MSFKKAGSGDRGMSSLLNGKKKRKNDPIFEALGTIDELNVSIGVLDAHWNWKKLKYGEDIREMLYDIQRRLIDLGSHVACNGINGWNPETTETVENTIKNYDKMLPKLTKFILPNGKAATFGQPRTICRRLERILVSLSDIVAFEALSFINRLSDLFFVLERLAMYNWNEGLEVEYSSKTSKNKNIKNRFDFLITRWIVFSSSIHLLEKNPQKICWYYLSKNHAAIHLLEKNLDKIDWWWLSMNPAAISLLEKYPDKIVWEKLCENPGAIHLLEKNPDKINWEELSKNPAAISLLEQNPDKINWNWLSLNPAAIHLLEKYPKMIDWWWLSMNPAAIHLLEKYPEKIYWDYLSRNPGAIHLLENYPEKINWNILSKNPAAIHLLEQNPEKIDWYYLSLNPAAI